MKTPSSTALFPWILSSTFLLSILIILGLGYYYFSTQQEDIKRKKHEELSAIAGLKVGQITQWREERLSDAKDIYENLIIARQVEAFIKSPNEKQRREELFAWLKSLKDHYFYSDVCLMDSKGSIRLSVPVQSTSLGLYTQEQIKKVLERREIFFSDIYMSEFSSSIYIDILVPLQLSDRKINNVIGIVLLRIDPSKLLFPLVQSWPMPSRTSETLLLERQGDSVVYLNELRHLKNTALTFRLPISNEKLIGSMAIRGIEETVEGSDYRGVPVLACIKKIQNSPWFMVAKVDQEEIYAPLRAQTFLIGLIVALLVFSITTAFGFWWRHQHALFYRKQYEAEVERQALVKHFDYLIKYANDIIILTDEYLNIREVNNRALETYGYTREELLHLKVENLRAPETVKDLRVRINTLDEHEGTRYETIHQRKDGTIFPVEASLRLIEIEGKKFYQAILHDITKRKRADEMLRTVEFSMDQASDAIFWMNRDAGFLYVNDQACRSLGYTREELLKLHLWDIDPAFPRKQWEADWEENQKDAGVSSHRIETLHRRKNGDVFPVDVSWKHILFDKTEMHVVSARDITEGKCAEEELRESEKRYRTLVEVSPDTIAVHAEGRIIYVNPAAVKLFNAHNESELIGKPVIDVVHPDYTELVRERVVGATEHGKAQPLIEEKFLCLDGTVVDVEVVSVPITFKGMNAVLVIARNITDRKQTEEALAQSEIKYRSLIETTDTGFVILDGTGSVLDANKEYVRLTGHNTLQQILGRNVTEWTAEHDRARNAEEVGKCIDQGFVRNMEIEYVDEKGRFTPVEINATVVKSGDSITIVTLCRDITGRKRADEVLRDTQEMLRIILDTIPVRVFWKDRSLNFLGSNIAFARDAGLNSPDDLVGKNDFEMTWAQQAELYRADDRKVMETGVPKVNYEEPQTSPDGSTIWVRTSKIPLLDEKGKVYGVLGTYEEITKRKQAEEALMQSNSFNEMLLQTMPFGMDIVDERGNILFINDFMKKLLGTDAMGQCCWTMYKDNQKQCTDCPLHKGIEFGKAETLESTGVLGGMTFQISHIGMMYNGKKAMLEVFQDVTEQKKLQQELLQVQKMESIGTLAGGVAHDFNNILAIILAYTSAMERSAVDKKKILEYCRTITQAVKRGAALVRQILTFARKADIVLAPMSLPDLINEIISMLKQTFPKVINFKEIVDNDIPFINADRTQIHQAMLNLCVNARDAMPKGGLITIKAERRTIDQVQERVPAANQDSYICISITDTGEGMKEATRRRIFDPFFTTKEEGKGTGLGLAVVYGVIQSHNAFIDVESAVGHGTTFRLYFPIPLLSEQMIDIPSATESFIIGGTETILLVEDEEPLRDMVRLILKSKGYKVLTAQDGNEAIKKYKLHKDEIDIVLTDMGLPEMTGLDMFKKIKKVKTNVKAIFASGFFEPDVKSEIMKAGAKGFIQKPYSPDEILRILRGVLDTK
jgi:PAS domain S-box-containing protein